MLVLIYARSDPHDEYIRQRAGDQQAIVTADMSSFTGHPPMWRVPPGLSPDGVHIHQASNSRERETPSPLPHIQGTAESTAGADHDLLEERALLEAIIEGSGDAIFVKDLSGKYVLLNAEAARIVGRSREELLGSDVTAIEPPERVRFIAEREREVLLSGMPVVYELNTVDRGESRTYLVTKSPYRNRDGQIIGLLGVEHDITERRRAEEALREGREKFESAFAFASIGMALVGLDGRWMQVNRALCDLVGYSEGELLSLTFQDITHPDDLDADLQRIRELVDGDIATYQLEKRYFHKAGYTVWALLSVSLVHGAKGEPLYFISQIQDITPRKRAEQTLQALLVDQRAMIEQVEYRAFHDPLTDLPNRSLLHERLQRTILNAEESGSSFALLFIDLHGFKSVNDVHGHDVGDVMLQEVAARLLEHVRPCDTVARLGGDEFAVLLEAADDRCGRAAAERLLDAFSAPFPCGDGTASLGASVGIALYPHHGDTAALLMRRADLAMYSIKRDAARYAMFAGD